MDRNRRLAELMKLEYHGKDCGCWDCIKGRTNDPDFTTDVWHKRLMDFCVGKEWWGKFVFWCENKVTWVDKPEASSAFYVYLWRNFVSLVDEYWQERGE